MNAVITIPAHPAIARGNGDFLGNLATSLLFYMLPLSVILAGREAAKYVAMKKMG